MTSLVQRLPAMLSIATLFDDEQRLLNRVWAVLLGLEALLVLVGAVSAAVQAVRTLRRRPARRKRVTIVLPAATEPAGLNSPSSKV
ncbi:hypothetical protein SPI_06781 [Niveomyces insectorum RCEF 264]|uniref:Uncharacterized protein n=1 Tax=Niveomyces insectorum RCEF 264 TaxID=1081102 RepID=A0A167QRJ5_9HYPO|nr:hypothetical protein SPI_06781 [Niveomyces insectorum RCEF 264]